MNTRWTTRTLSAAAIALIAVGAETTTAQPNLQPRLAAAKQDLSTLAAMPASGRVVVKFAEGRRIRLQAGELAGVHANEAAAFAHALGLPLQALRRLHARDEAELDQERAEAERDSGRELADLNLYYVVDLPKGVDAAQVADRLNRLDFVEFAEPGPVPAPPPVDIAPATPNLTANQTYKGPAPQGIGALEAAGLPGGTGKGIRVVDVEYSWQLDHEDLEMTPDRVLTGGATPVDPFNDTNHGMAVLGEIVGKKNNYGVTGIAASAKAWVAPANTSQFAYDPARAIGIATGFLKKGEVMIIEQQYWVCGLPGAAYGPLEVLQSVFDAVSAATAKGIIVVAAAGNGNVNLDGANCNNLFNRAVRDSQAIIVGAGTSTDHSRLSFSSYGSRVDVQAWGHNVTTAGYGDAFNPGDIRQRYTFGFSGTSSATPIVTGAVISMQGIVKACGMKLLKPLVVRQALASTGTPQASPGTGNIGPLPRIREAIEATPAASCL